MPPLSTIISRLAGLSWRSILYERPEQPPPTTATRNTPLGRPCLVSNAVTFLAALGVILIKRSSPNRNPGASDVCLAVRDIMSLLSYRRANRPSTRLRSHPSPGYG